MCHGGQHVVPVLIGPHDHVRVKQDTLVAFHAALAKYSLRTDIDKVDYFYSSWKDYRSRVPVERPANGLGAAEGALAIDINAMMGGDDDGDVSVTTMWHCFQQLQEPLPLAAAAAPAGTAAAAADESN
jgi:hypothetical protein